MLKLHSATIKRRWIEMAGPGEVRAFSMWAAFLFGANTYVTPLPCGDLKYTNGQPA